MGRPKSKDPRDRSIRVPVTTAELEQLHALADDDGVSLADVLRAYIRKEHAKRFGERKGKR